MGTNKNDKNKRKPLKESQTFLTCSIHSIKYPRGASCPRCDQEKRK